MVLVIIASTTATFLPVSSQGAAGELYESDLDTGSIAKFTAQGARTSAATGIFDLFGVAFNSKGELFAASDMGNTIYKIAANGTKTIFTSAVSAVPSRWRLIPMTTFRVQFQNRNDR